MARTKRNAMNIAEARPKWDFYVYEIIDGELTVYVGKGSGSRMRKQERRFGLSARETARFKSEQRAYAFERSLIAELKPKLNRHPGGNGSRCKRRQWRVPAWVREIEAVGTRRYAARMLLSPRLMSHIDPSKIGELRRVANGPRC